MRLRGKLVAALPFSVADEEGEGEAGAAGDEGPEEGAGAAAMGRLEDALRQEYERVLRKVRELRALC